MDPTAPPLAHPIRCLHEEPWAPCFDDFENRTRLDGAQHKAVAAGILGDHPNRLDLDGAICLSHGWFAHETHQEASHDNRHYTAHSTSSHHFVHRRQS